MHTLREVVDLTGAAGPAGQEVGSGTRPLSLRSCADLVAAVLPAEQRLSLRALCAGLPTLPPITLDARITAHEDVVAPSRPVIEVDPPAGAVVETVVTFFSGGAVATPASSAIRLVDGQKIDGTVFAAAVFTAPGTYEAVVRRVGVTGSGVVTLERRLPFRVRAVQPPAPPPGPTPTPAPGPTGVPTCGVEVARAGFGGVTDVRVFGQGFTPGEGLNILQDATLATTTSADALGSYAVVLGVPDATPPAPHRFQAVSQATGRASKEAGFTV